MTDSYLLSVLRNWWIIMVVGALGAGGAAAFALTQPEEFRASVKFVVAPDSASLPEGEVTDANRALESGSLQQTLALMLSAGSTREAAAATLAVDDSLYDIRSYALTRTNAVQLDVAGPSGSEARRLANEIAAVGTDQFGSLYAGYVTEVISAPDEAATPIGPAPVTFGVIGGAVGAFLGFLIGLARDAVRADRARAGESRRDRRDRRGSSLPPNAQVPPPPPPVESVARVVLLDDPEGAVGDLVPTMRRTSRRASRS